MMTQTSLFNTKVCKDCNTERPLSSFYFHKGMRDGYLNKCKSCVTFRIREFRKNNDSVRKYDLRRSREPERKAKLAVGVKRYKKEHPEKYKAHCAVNNAVRDGHLIKPAVCSECNKEKRLTGHHDDYSKPLEVRWLCYRCHALHHHQKDTYDY